MTCMNTSMNDQFSYLYSHLNIPQHQVQPYHYPHYQANMNQDDMNQATMNQKNTNQDFLNQDNFMNQETNLDDL